MMGSQADSIQYTVRALKDMIGFMDALATLIRDGKSSYLCHILDNPTYQIWEPLDTIVKEQGNPDTKMTVSYDQKNVFFNNIDIIEKVGELPKIITDKDWVNISLPFSSILAATNAP